MKRSCILIGNYGDGNFGDELLREYFLGTFSLIEWKVISAESNVEFPRLPCGIRSLFTSWWRTVRAFWKADVVVFGGGTLFTDSESIQACFLWSLHAFVARLMGKEIVLAFQGFGPFHTRLGAWITKAVCRTSSLIITRDARSYSWVKSYVLNKKIVQSIDPITSIKIEQNQNRTKKVIIIPRKNSSEVFHEQLRDTLQKFPLKEYLYCIASLQPEDPYERVITHHLSQEFDDCSVCEIRTLLDFCTLCGDASFILSERFHATILAKKCGVPCQSVSKHPDDKHATILDPTTEKSQKLYEEGLHALEEFLYTPSAL